MKTARHVRRGHWMMWAKVSMPIHRAMAMMTMMHEGIVVDMRTIGSVPSSRERRSLSTMRQMRAARSHVEASGSRSHRLT